MQRAMSETALIARTLASQSLPITFRSMHADLTRLGLVPGMVVLVHSSMKSLGYVVGGAQAVVMALEASVGIRPPPPAIVSAAAATAPASTAASPALPTSEQSTTTAPLGTLVMPSFSSDNNDPRLWEGFAVPTAWHAVWASDYPAYDPDLTPSRFMGAVVECFRAGKATLRSPHPALSFVGSGALARDVLNVSSLPAGTKPALDYPTGCPQTSPLARLYDLKSTDSASAAHVLLLGVTHANNTSLHLAEYRARWPSRTVYQNGTAIINPLSGCREWVTYDDVWGESDDFVEIGTAFATAHPKLVRRGRVGLANCLLIPQRELVDFAVAWIEQHRVLSKPTLLALHPLSAEHQFAPYLIRLIASYAGLVGSPAAAASE